MNTTYVLIDYENVQPNVVACLNHAHVRVLVFLGAHQTKISCDVASALQYMGPRAEYIRLTGHGNNALDMHIAFFIGQIATTDPNASFHIISKDTGFDPLIDYLKSKQIRVARSIDIKDIPFVKAAQAASGCERLPMIISDLRNRGASKPRTVKTLSSTINAIFQKSLSEEDVASLVQELQRRRLIKVNNTKITYSLPAS